MKIIIMLMSIMVVLQTLRISLLFLKKDVSLIKKIISILILLIMVIICYMIMHYSDKKIYFYFSIFFIIYVFVMFIYDHLVKKSSISFLSVKKAIDMSDNGILFLNNKNDIVLINNIMKDILDNLNIRKDYINSLKSNSIKEVADSYLIKCLNKVWQLKINANEIVAVDITDIYKLQEEIELQNKLIEENNKKIILTINNIEKLEKTKNLLKLKNEYHDLLGYRLALFTKYLEKDNVNKNDISFLLDKVFEDINININKSIEDRLQELIKMYSLIGVNINLKGRLPKDKNISTVFFEIIREAITNAIIHAESKNIDILINSNLLRNELVITNDGKKPNNIINENEGIKGMRRKLSLLKGSLTIITDDKFTLKIII